MKMLDTAAAALTAALFVVGASAIHLGRIGSTNGFDHLRSSIIRIQSVSKSFDWLQPFMPGSDQVGLGSGFVVQTEPYPLIVTNAHVINDAMQVTLQLLVLGEQQWEAQVVSVCPKFDIALLVFQDPAGFMNTLEEQNIALSKLELAGGVAAMGQDVVALGFPLGQDALKISKGNIAGNEEVDGNICIQSTAPISPGSSGGPLLNADGSKVLGVNFAKASEGENINYVIPAWRVRQLVAKHLKDQAAMPHVESENFLQKLGTWQRVQVHVPEPEITTIEANDALYMLSKGCTSGVFVARVGERSFFKKAEPPVSPRTFLVSVNGNELDGFGSGMNTEYAADRVSFQNLFYMANDLEGDVQFETCSKGVRTTHNVSIRWLSEYGRGLRFVDEPMHDGVATDYEIFGDIAIMEMTVNHINTIVSKMGDPGPARWMHPDYVAKPRLIVSHVRSGSYSADVLFPGAAIARINGHEVRTLAQLRDRFLPHKDSVWTLETDTGAMVAMMFNESLGQQLEEAETHNAPYLLTPGVLSAAKNLGFALQLDGGKTKIEKVGSGLDHGNEKNQALASMRSRVPSSVNVTTTGAGPLLVKRTGALGAKSGFSRKKVAYTTRGAAAPSMYFVS